MTGRTSWRGGWASVGLCWLAVGGVPVAGAASPSLIGQRAPDFALPAVEGSNERLSEYGGQPVILWFWSSRCSVCGRQLAMFDRLYATYRAAGLMVLAVSIDDDLDRARSYALDHKSSFPMLLDAGKSVGRLYDVERLPSAVLIDRSGVVRFVHDDALADPNAYVSQLRALVDDSLN